MKNPRREQRGLKMIFGLIFIVITVMWTQSMAFAGVMQGKVNSADSKSLVVSQSDLVSGLTISEPISISEKTVFHGISSATELRSGMEVQVEMKTNAFGLMEAKSITAVQPGAGFYPQTETSNANMLT